MGSFDGDLGFERQGGKILDVRIVTFSEMYISEMLCCWWKEFSMTCFAFSMWLPA
jgi:hypothetical protein